MPSTIKARRKNRSQCVIPPGPKTRGSRKRITPAARSISTGAGETGGVLSWGVMGHRNARPVDSGRLAGYVGFQLAASHHGLKGFGDLRLLLVEHIEDLPQPVPAPPGLVTQACDQDRTDDKRNLKEPIVMELADSLVERRTIAAGPKGLAGERIEFPGLQLTMR